MYGDEDDESRDTEESHRSPGPLISHILDNDQG